MSRCDDVLVADEIGVFGGSVGRPRGVDDKGDRAMPVDGNSIVAVLAVPADTLPVVTAAADVVSTLVAALLLE